MFGLKRHKRREIFTFWDGSRKRQADPLKILRALNTDAEFNADKHADAAFEGDDDSRAITLRAIQRAFGVQEFSDGGTARPNGGLTEKEMLELFASFCEYIGELKKNSSLTPTSQPATEPAPLAGSITSAA